MSDELNQFTERVRGRIRKLEAEVETLRADGEADRKWRLWWALRCDELLEALRTIEEWAGMDYPAGRIEAAARDAIAKVEGGVS